MKYTRTQAYLNTYLNTQFSHTHTRTHTHTHSHMAECYYNAIWRKRCQFCHVSQKGQIANVSFFLFILIILSGSKSLHQKGAVLTKEGLSSQISSTCVSSWHSLLYTSHLCTCLTHSDSLNYLRVNYNISWCQRDGLAVTNWSWIEAVNLGRGILIWADFQNLRCYTIMS